MQPAPSLGLGKLSNMSASSAREAVNHRLQNEERTMLPMAVAAAQETYISVPEGNKIVAASHRAWRADLSERKDWGPLPQGDAAWTLPEDVLGDYFVRFASTTRPAEESLVRLVYNIKCSAGGASAASFTVGMLHGLVPAHLLLQVAARVLLKKDDAGIHVCHIMEAVCLHRNRVQAADGSAAKGSRGGSMHYKECRGGPAVCTLSLSSAACTLPS